MSRRYFQDHHAVDKNPSSNNSSSPSLSNTESRIITQPSSSSVQSSSSFPSSSSVQSSTSLSSSTSSLPLQATASLPQKRSRHPVIIYDNPPKVIHTTPENFKSIVQKLTGKPEEDVGKDQELGDHASGMSSCFDPSGVGSSNPDTDIHRPVSMSNSSSRTESLSAGFLLPHAANASGFDTRRSCMDNRRPAFSSNSSSRTEFLRAGSLWSHATNAPSFDPWRSDMDNRRPAFTANSSSTTALIANNNPQGLSYGAASSLLPHAINASGFDPRRSYMDGHSPGFNSNPSSTTNQPVLGYTGAGSFLLPPATNLSGFDPSNSYMGNHRPFTSNLSSTSESLRASSSQQVLSHRGADSLSLPPATNMSSSTEHTSIVDNSKENLELNCTIYDFEWIMQGTQTDSYTGAGSFLLPPASNLSGFDPSNSYMGNCRPFTSNSSSTSESLRASSSQQVLSHGGADSWSLPLATNMSSSIGHTSIVDNSKENLELNCTIYDFEWIMRGTQTDWKTKMMLWKETTEKVKGIIHGTDYWSDTKKTSTVTQITWRLTDITWQTCIVHRNVWMDYVNDPELMGVFRELQEAHRNGGHA